MIKRITNEVVGTIIFAVLVVFGIAFFNGLKDSSPEAREDIQNVEDSFLSSMTILEIGAGIAGIFGLFVALYLLVKKFFGQAGYPSGDGL